MSPETGRLGGGTGSAPSQGRSARRTEELHCRRIELRGYRLDDGSFEIEGKLIDTKPFDFAPASAEYIVPADTPIHEMGVILAFGDDMIVRDVRTFINAAPYDICAGAGVALRSIIGLQIGRGWNREVQRLLPPTTRCTHLAELLGPMATAALQAMSGQRKGRPDPVDRSGRPLQIGTCFAYSPAREIVQRRWPQYYEPQPAEKEHSDL